MIDRVNENETQDSDLATRLHLLEQIYRSAVRRFREECMGDIEQHVNHVIEEYKDVVVSRSWKIAQKWVKWDDVNEHPVLWPDYTRLYYRKGNMELLVQEFPPQIRVLQFTEALLKKTSNEGVISRGGTIHNFSLALPYVVFVFKFQEGDFSEVYVGFSDRPLKTMREPIYRPYLSNISSDLKVCLGSNFSREHLLRGNLTQQSAYVLGHFWQTAYNDELSSHYWNYKTHFAHDSRLKDLPSWQNASIDNPLFVIDNVNWLNHSVECWGDMISSLSNFDSVDVEFNKEIYKSMLDGFEEKIKTVIATHIENVDVKVNQQILNKLALEFQHIISNKV
jgi:hypothetical protein